MNLLKFYKILKNIHGYEGKILIIEKLRGYFPDSAIIIHGVAIILFLSF